MFSEISVFEVRRLSPQAHEALGLRILVMRRWPQGITKDLVDCWLPDAGPSLTLLRALRDKEISWSVFAAHYEMEQKQLQACKMVTYKQGKKFEEHFHHSPLRQLQILEQIYPQGRIMCWEKEGLPCHRHLLLALLHPESQEIPQCLLPTPSPKGEQS
jgi:uncharacterized protein YeaO (DUF488 family)